MASVGDAALLEAANIYRPVKIYDPNKTISCELDRTAYLLRRAKGQRVLHVGCTDFPITKCRLDSNNLLHAHLAKEAAYLVGLDNAVEGVRLLEAQGFPNIVLMDAEDICLKEQFDVVIAGDVLEHMTNPGHFLEKVGHLLRETGTLIVGVPNAYSFNILKYLLSGYEPTHKDHTYFFSVKTLSELCGRYDLLPTKLIFTVQPEWQYRRSLIGLVRNGLVKLQKSLAPSIIMEFMRREDIRTTDFVEWQ